MATVWGKTKFTPDVDSIEMSKHEAMYAKQRLFTKEANFSNEKHIETTFSESKNSVWERFFFAKLFILSIQDSGDSSSSGIRFLYVGRIFKVLPCSLVIRGWAHRFLAGIRVLSRSAYSIPQD